MTSNENLEINAESPSYILYAPKLKLKKPTITPTPFSLNDSFSDEEIDASEENDNSFEEGNVVNNLSDIKTSITPFSIKMKKCIKN